MSGFNNRDTCIEHGRAWYNEPALVPGSAGHERAHYCTGLTAALSHLTQQLLVQLPELQITRATGISPYCYASCNTEEEFQKPTSERNSDHSGRYIIKCFSGITPFFGLRSTEGRKGGVTT